MNQTMNVSRMGGAQDASVPVVRSLHHLSFYCRDAEETRRFYEDFLGLEFVAAIPVSVDPRGKPVDALQLLFRMAKGDFLMFYDVANDHDGGIYDSLTPWDMHIGMKVSSEAELMTWIDRVKEAGLEFVGPLDHDFIRSIYFNDPNGIILEITYQVPEHEEILDKEESRSKKVLADWTVKTAPQKQKFTNPFAIKESNVKEGDR